MDINTIYNESCLNTMAKMPNKFVNCIVTSPPYNLRLRVSKNKYISRKDNVRFTQKYQCFSDDLPQEEFYQFHSTALKEMLRVSSIVCYNIGVATGSKESFFRIIGEFRHSLKDIITWDKEHAQPSMGEGILNTIGEYILIFEGDNQLGRQIKNSQFKRGTEQNIIRIMHEFGSKHNHGATFPMELPRRLIDMFCPKNGIVYDPFMGTGTTAIAALVSGRNFIGSEVISEYATIASQQIIDFQKQLRFNYED